MVQGPLKSLTEREKDEILLEARRLEALGISAAATLRHAQREVTSMPSEPATSEVSFRDDPVLEVLKWATRDPVHRSKLPPELEPLSVEEEASIRTAMEATRMGLEVWEILASEMSEEEHLRSDRDRKCGRLTDLSGLPVDKILEEDRFALNSFRVRRLFYSWLETCDKKKARHLITILRRFPRGLRAERVISVYYEVHVQRHNKGLSLAEAIKHVASNGTHWTFPLVEGDGLSPNSPDSEETFSMFPDVGPMSVDQVKALLNEYRAPRKKPREKRTRAKKPKIT